MARTRKPAEERKAEVVRAAIRLAGEIGPDRVTTQILADAVGVSQPAIFRHFPTKSDIWLAVGEAIAGRLAAERGEFADDIAPDKALIALVSRHLGHFSKSPAVPAILFSRELHAENEALRQHFEAVMTDRRTAMSKLTARAIDLGIFRKSLAPDDAAALVLAAIQGIAMRWSLENRRFELEAEGTRLISCLIDGFRKNIG